MHFTIINLKEEIRAKNNILLKEGENPLNKMVLNDENLMRNMEVVTF